MRDFTVDDQPRGRSVGFDATQRSGTTVTVGISLDREAEASLLDSLYTELQEYDYRPFQTKSRDLDLPPEIVIDILQNCDCQAGILYHRDDVKLGYAEPTHSAILLEELEAPVHDSVVIVDGGPGVARKLYWATDGIDLEAPPIANAVRSELYYPHQLLADLVAGVVADRINEQNGAPEPISATDPIQVVRDTTPESYEGAWGKGFQAVAQGAGRVPEAAVTRYRGETPRERVSCWYHGVFSSTNREGPPTDGVQPIVGSLQRLGCTDVAEWIASG